MGPGRFSTHGTKQHGSATCVTMVIHAGQVVIDQASRVMLKDRIPTNFRRRAKDGSCRTLK